MAAVGACRPAVRSPGLNAAGARSVVRWFTRGKAEPRSVRRQPREVSSTRARSPSCRAGACLVLHPRPRVDLAPSWRHRASRLPVLAVSGVSRFAALSFGARRSNGSRSRVVASGGSIALHSERSASWSRRGYLRLCSRCAALHSRCCLGLVARGSRVGAASVLGLGFLRLPRPRSALGGARRRGRVAGLRAAPPGAGAVRSLGHARPRLGLGCLACAHVLRGWVAPGAGAHLVVRPRSLRVVLYPHRALPPRSPERRTEPAVPRLRKSCAEPRRGASAIARGAGCRVRVLRSRSVVSPGTHSASPRGRRLTSARS
jgi:hypothetical protein